MKKCKSFSLLTKFLSFCQKSFFSLSAKMMILLKTLHSAFELKISSPSLEEEVQLLRGSKTGISLSIAFDLDPIILKTHCKFMLCCNTGPFYKVCLLESVSGMSRRDVVINQFIFLLTQYRPRCSFYINLESDYSN